MSRPRILTHQDYTVGWICALPNPELAAALFMLDGDEHPRLPRRQADTNNYTLGNIGLHNVVIACLPQGEYGISSAADVASHMRHSFPNIQFGLMVGIAGGVPDLPRVDIRLGDVVVSKPGLQNGGVIQYDFGKAMDGVFEPTGWLNAPPTILRTAIGTLEARSDKWGNEFVHYLSAFESQRDSKFANPGLENDQLHDASDPTKVVARSDRTNGPVVHYGTIASGSSLIKDGKTRDKLREKHGIRCFEMEAAGLMNNFPCAVIRGICDYADSHINKQWQPYAAATAAAYAKYLLSYIDPIETRKEDTRSKEEEACLTALFLTDPRDDRERIIHIKGPRVDGTCEWIKANELYDSWLHSRAQLLWLSGGPGKGKTMLSIFLAGELERIANNSQDVLFIQYFCDNRDEKRNTATAIIRGLIFQLLSLRPKLFDHILPIFNVQKESLFTYSSFEALWRIFENMVHDPVPSTTYCVLDGLDECEEVSLELLLKKFKALFSKKLDESPACRLKLIALSRDLPDFIPELLSSFPRIRLDPDADREVDSDICRFIEAKVDELSTSGHYPEPLRRHVKHVFLSRAKGTFLWVGIVANELRNYKLSEVENALELFPPGLERLYARMLLQINDHQRETAAKILCWVVMAVRPLKLSELSVAIETTGRPSVGLSCDEVIRDQVAFCGYFLMIKGDEVGLIHQSAKDYLLRKTPDPNPKLEYFRIEEDKVNLEIAQKCLTYLQNGALDEGAVALEDGYRQVKDTSRLEAFPLLSYATLHWFEHARSLASSEDIFDISSPFYKEKSLVREYWLKTYSTAKVNVGIRTSFPLLHLASCFDINPLVKNLLSKTGQMRRLKLYIDVNKRDGHGQTPLHYAAAFAQEAMVLLLLEKGARIGAKGGGGWTALHSAATFGRETMVRLLVEMGALVDAKDRNGETALYWAARNGHEAVVRLLLENGARVDTKTMDGQTALDFAARSGNDAVIHLLKSLS